MGKQKEERENELGNLINDKEMQSTMRHIPSSLIGSSHTAT